MRSGNEPTCRLEIQVGRDCERFSSPTDFEDQVTREALNRFTDIYIAVQTEQAKVEVTLARLPGHRMAVTHAPGVLLTVSSSTLNHEVIDAIRDSVAAAIDRGGYRFTHDQKTGPHRHLDEHGGVLAEVSTPPLAILQDRVSHRNRAIARLYLGLALGAAVALLIAARTLGIAVSGKLATLALGWIAPAVVVVVARLTQLLAPGRGALLWTWLRALVLPAVAIAERTPARRGAQLLLRAASIVVAPLAGVLVNHVLGIGN